MLKLIHLKQKNNFSLNWTTNNCEIKCVSKLLYIVIYTIKILYILGEEYLEKFNYRKWSRAVTVKDYRTELEVG